MPSAIILFGLVHRSLAHTAASLRKNIILPLEEFGDVHVFYHTWDANIIHNPRAREFSKEIDVSDIKRYLPEARGVIDSQIDFDESVDWNAFAKNNPMRAICATPDSALITLKNARRALESCERAWAYYQKAKTCDYDRVLLTRADLNFQSPIRVPGELAVETQAQAARTKNIIYVPRFHEWGGVNDRFALCSEEAARFWCKRTAFFDGWLQNASQHSTEWVLLQWLKRNGIKISFLNIVFKRIRADGSVAEYDRPLRAQDIDPNPITIPSRKSLKKRPANANGRAKARFLILARRPNPESNNLLTKLSTLGRAEIISDTPTEAAVWRPNEQIAGFQNITRLGKHTAWDRAFFRLEEDPPAQNEKIWFVEEDVAGSTTAFGSVIEMTPECADLAALDIGNKRNDPNWPHWAHANGYFEDPWRAFLPMCRISPRLLEAALNFRRKTGKFIFHEVLLASLVRENHFHFCDWRTEPAVSQLFHMFRYRPDIVANYDGICHPVKTSFWHNRICE